MRKQKTTIVWPAYFDSSKTRKAGRRVPKSEAVSNPSLAELQLAAGRLGLNPQIEGETAHPAFPYRKTGRVLIQMKETKMQTLTKMAKEIVKIRQQTK